MMNVQANVAAMNAAGGAVGPPPAMDQGPMRSHFGDNEHKRLNTYIYDYLLKMEKFDVARTFHQHCQINTKPGPSPGRVNGVDDGMDTDSKDSVMKKPADLPLPDLPPMSDNNTSFLYDWWCQFWDVYGARHRPKDKEGTTTMSYLQQIHSQQKGRQAMQQSMLQAGIMRGQFGGNMMMQPNGMQMNNEMAKRVQQNTRNATPQQMQQMAQAKMMNPMQRDGSNMDMSGQRSNSPGSMENAPSPSKRPRLEGANAFNGQPMGPAGRGQPMSGPQMSNLNAAAGPNGGMLLQNGVPDLQQQQMAFAGQNPALQAKQIEVYQHQLAQQQRVNMNNVAKAMNANLPQNQMPGQGMEGMDFGGMNARQMGAAGPNQTGNHALQDYQMQLMLLEQQNKKRLLMARQEHDNVAHPHPGSGPNPQFTMAPSMSPSQSRAGGPSPNPNEMKRDGPKMGQVPGSPMPDMQNRGSPVPGFDPSQMHPGMYAQMANMGRPPSSHPGFPGGNLNPQQIEAMRRNAGMMPNGQAFPQGGPQMLQQSMPQPQPQMGTPQQRPGTMPPPPAPASQEHQRTQPSSPAQQNQAPPTPSQAPKNAAKGKKETKGGASKKNPPKKQGTTGATPVAENAEPPTPTPSTPITPRHPDSFNKQNGANAANAQQPPNAAANPPQPGPAQQPPAPAPAMPVPAPTMDFDMPQDFGLSGLGDDFTSGINLDFSTDLGNTDVLENFDFDSLLNTDGGIQFDG